MHEHGPHSPVFKEPFGEVAQRIKEEEPVAPATQPFRTSRGRSTPLGVISLAQGVNFVLMCRHGTSIHLVLQHAERDDMLAEIPLDPSLHRTGDLWHIH